MDRPKPTACSSANGRRICSFIYLFIQPINPKIWSPYQQSVRTHKTRQQSVASYRSDVLSLWPQRLILNRRSGHAKGCRMPPLYRSPPATFPKKKSKVNNPAVKCINGNIIKTMMTIYTGTSMHQSSRNKS